MNYYCIRESLDKKVLGHYPQVKEYMYHCNVDDPKFIEQLHFVKADYEPLTANAVLYNTSKPTDLISATGVGFTKKLLISGRLRSILEFNRKTGMQFFNSLIIHKNKEIEDYWILNFYEIEMNTIDFEYSDVFLTKNVFNKLEKINIKSFEDFLNKKAEIDIKGYPYGVIIERLKLIDGNKQDFFALLDVEGGVKYVVSEQLKKQIEDSGCTGIEFMPSELTLNEWLQGGEREKIYGKV